MTKIICRVNFKVRHITIYVKTKLYISKKIFGNELDGMRKSKVTLTLNKPVCV